MCAVPFRLPTANFSYIENHFLDAMTTDLKVNPRGIYAEMGKGVEALMAAFLSPAEEQRGWKDYQLGRVIKTYKSP